MSSRFKIEVSPEPCDDDSGRAVFIVEVAPALIRLEEVHVELGAGGVQLPRELAKLDFHTCMSIASTLSRGSFAVTNQVAATAEKPSSRSSTNPASGQSARVKNSTATVAPTKSDRPRSGAPSDLRRTYWRLGGSVAKVAKHYNVPRQIAKDWVKELRNGNSTSHQ